jgi:predicted O-linked N-acetylglucosamine transferase (SPINDLY family)
LNSHDRNRFHVFAYSFAPANLRDSIVSTLNDCAESVRDLADVSWDRALRRIRSDKLDILIDTTRNIRGAPLPLMTRRMAPTQVSAWGFGGAPNSAAIDIILGDGTTYPKGEDQNYHQPLVRLNAYLPPVENAHAELLLAPRNAKETAPPECIVLGSFVTHYKIDETVFTCWLRVLQQVPSSVIWLMAGTKTSRNNLRRYAAQRGVDPKRLHFTESVPRRQHLARLSQVDLILDNPRMGGSASIPDALATATPGITWQGELPEERGGASCLRAAGFPDLVAADINEYERLAVRLARSSAIRHSVRLRMAQHVKGAEAKVGTWVRQLEATLDDIALRQRQAQQFEKGA